jgi:hypothetical protein
LDPSVIAELQAEAAAREAKKMAEKAAEAACWQQRAAATDALESRQGRQRHWRPFSNKGLADVATPAWKRPYQFRF